jgi:hypothetical protein
MEPIYSQTGGCCIGRNAWLAINASWPFAGLSVYTEELVLSTFLRRLRFRREDIFQVERYNGIFSTGVRIVHTVASYPRHVVFWARDIAELEEALRANAFPVGTPTI